MFAEQRQLSTGVMEYAFHEYDLNGNRSNTQKMRYNATVLCVDWAYDGQDKPVSAHQYGPSDPGKCDGRVAPTPATIAPPAPPVVPVLPNTPPVVPPPPPRPTVPQIPLPPRVGIYLPIIAARGGVLARTMMMDVGRQMTDDAWVGGSSSSVVSASLPRAAAAVTYDKSYFGYDALGRRVSKDVVDCNLYSQGIFERTEYDYDGLVTIAEREPLAGKRSNLYRGPAAPGMPGNIAFAKQHAAPSAPATTRWYAHDGLNSVIGLSDEIGYGTHNYQYDAFGQRMAGFLSQAVLVDCEMRKMSQTG